VTRRRRGQEAEEALARLPAEIFLENFSDEVRRKGSGLQVTSIALNLTNPQE
jgi:hypothetical protein